MLSPSLASIRIFLHVLAASVWVGGQITLGGIVPAVRRAHPQATKVIAQAFGRVAWLAFGVALLGIGIVFNSQRARLASAAVIALTILKAFSIDVWTLTGVYRALSFICLGVVLIAIAWLYQRILFRRTTPPAAVAQPGA